MSSAELTRLSKDIHSKPDLLMEVVNRNGKIDEIIKYVNAEGYKIKNEDFGSLVNHAPNFTKMTRGELVDRAGVIDPNQDQAAFAVIAVVVAIFLWVI